MNYIKKLSSKIKPHFNIFELFIGIVSPIILFSFVVWSIKFVATEFVVTTMYIYMPQSLAMERACNHFYPGSYATASYNQTSCWKRNTKVRLDNKEAVKLGEVQYQITDADIQMAKVEIDHYKNAPWYSIYIPSKK